MNIFKLSTVIATVGLALFAQAETRTIEGRGRARDAAGLTVGFTTRVSQTNSNAATGRFNMTWTRGDVTVSVTCEAPHMVAIRGHEGRFDGRAVARIQRGGDTRTWEGVVRVTVWDLKRPENPTGKDKIRMRFIRNPWESPEGDFFFQGELTEGDLVVRRS